MNPSIGASTRNAKEKGWGGGRGQRRERRGVGEGAESERGDRERGWGKRGQRVREERQTKRGMGEWRKGVSTSERESKRRNSEGKNECMCCRDRTEICIWNLPSKSMLPMSLLKSLSVWRPVEEKKLSELNWMLSAAKYISLFKTSFTCTCHYPTHMTYTYMARMDQFKPCITGPCTYRYMYIHMYVCIYITYHMVQSLVTDNS